jgi:hypothetical protein
MSYDLFHVLLLFGISIKWDFDFRYAQALAVFDAKMAPDWYTRKIWREIHPIWTHLPGVYLAAQLSFGSFPTLGEWNYGIWSGLILLKSAVAIWFSRRSADRAIRAHNAGFHAGKPGTASNASTGDRHQRSASLFREEDNSPVDQ